MPLSLLGKLSDKTLVYVASHLHKQRSPSLLERILLISKTKRNPVGAWLSRSWSEDVSQF